MFIKLLKTYAPNLAATLLIVSKVAAKGYVLIFDIINCDIFASMGWTIDLVSKQ